MQVLFSPSRQVELFKVAFDFRAVHPRNSKASSWPNLLGRLQWLLGGIAGAAVKQGKCIDNYLHNGFEAPNGSGLMKWNLISSLKTLKISQQIH